MKMKRFSLLAALIMILAVAPFTAFASDSYGDLGWHYITTSYKITSPYGWRGSEFHKGFDIGVNEENAYSMSAGEVLLAGYSSSAGNWVVIKSNDKDPNGNNLTARYLHMKNYGVWTGKTVVRGEYLGITGQTGDADGPHLHFDVNNQNKINGSDIDSSNSIDPKRFWPNAPWTTLSPSLKAGTTHEGDINLAEAIPDFLIDYVGQATFEKWVEKTGNPVLNTFLNDFGIAKEKIESIKTNFIAKKNASVK